MDTLTRALFAMTSIDLVQMHTHWYSPPTYGQCQCAIHCASFQQRIAHDTREYTSQSDIDLMFGTLNTSRNARFKTHGAEGKRISTTFCSSGGESEGRLNATTFYEPVAWFTDRLKSDTQCPQSFKAFDSNIAFESHAFKAWQLPRLFGRLSVAFWSPFGCHVDRATTGTPCCTCRSSQVQNLEHNGDVSTAMFGQTYYTMYTGYVSIQLFQKMMETSINYKPQEHAAFLWAKGWISVIEDGGVAQLQ